MWPLKSSDNQGLDNRGTTVVLGKYPVKPGSQYDAGAASVVSVTEKSISSPDKLHS